MDDPNVVERVSCDDANERIRELTTVVCNLVDLLAAMGIIIYPPPPSPIQGDYH